MYIINICQKLFHSTLKLGIDTWSRNVPFISSQAYITIEETFPKMLHFSKSMKNFVKNIKEVYCLVLMKLAFTFLIF